MSILQLDSVTYVFSYALNHNNTSIPSTSTFSNTNNIVDRIDQRNRI